MKFTIAIEPGTKKTAFGVAVPDLPGCFSAGDTVEEAFDNVRKAIEAAGRLLKQIDDHAKRHHQTVNPTFATWQTLRGSS